MKQFVTVLLLILSISSFSQLLTWELSADGTGVSNQQELTCLNFTAGNGLSSFTFASTGAYAKSWSNASLDPDDYFQVGFISSAQDTFELNSIEYSERRSSTGIHNYELRYSTDSNFVTYTSMGIVSVPDNDSERDTVINNVDVLIIPQDTFYLRWYAYNAESSAGSWRINDGSLKMFLSTYVEDLTAPNLLVAEVVNAQTIQMSFDESIDASSFQLSDFQINQSINPSALDISLVSQGIIKLTFSNDLPQEQSLNLRYRNIADESGNTIVGEQFVELFYYQAKAFYVLIDEIMADPSPTVYLPESEYIELYNSKDFAMNLEGWTLDINSYSYILPICEIPAKSYLLLVPIDNKSLFDSTLNMIEVFPDGKITNSEARITLHSPEGEWVHQVNYTEDWHTENYKKNGGWSVEMIDKVQPCNMLNNWSSSVDNLGGTPDKDNSINGENTKLSDLEILNVYFDTTNVIIQFNQYLDPTYQPNQYCFLLDANSPNTVVYQIGEDYMSLSFDDVYEENTPYNLTISDTIFICDGSYIDIPFTLRIGIPTQVDSNDIVINEIFFNPIGDNKQYVEFYNQSDKILDLQEMKLAVLDDDIIKPKDVISDVPMIVFPKDYFVLTKDRNNILSQFNVKYPDRLFQTEEIPSLSTTEDYFYLLNKGDKVIDEIHYMEDFHNPILSEVEGVSLEKVNPKSSGLTASAWQSASQSSGFGTPTYQNSQFSDENTESDDVISFESETFSPDMDGYKDYLIINYKLEKSGYAANVNIYDSKGHYIYELVSNEYTGREGQWTWDGRDMNKESSPLGIYILVFEFIHADGSVIEEKKVCTIAGKL